MCETIGVFNTDAAGKAKMFEKCGLDPGANLMQVLRKENSVRVQDAARKAHIKYRQQRQKLRCKHKSKADKLSCHPGAFGLTSKSVIVSDKVLEKRKRKRKEHVVKDVTVSSQGVSEICIVEPVPKSYMSNPKKLF